ncbi:MAG: sensor histidine kinase [Mucilaginibacter sp.]
MRISVRYKLFLFSFVILGINIALGYAVYNSNQKLLSSEQWLQHSEQVIIQSSNIRSLSREMQITSRDFLITDDSVFLEPLNHTQKAAFGYIVLLRQLTRDNPGQQKLTDSLELYMHKLVNYSSKTIGSRGKQGISSVIAYTTDKSRKRYTERINQIANAIQSQEEILYKQRRQMNARNEVAFSRFSMAIFISMATVTILLVIIAGKYLYLAIEKRKRAAELVIANRELLFQNQEKGDRAAELLVANDELYFQNEEKGKRAQELLIANNELLFQNEEKGKRAEELLIANNELLLQNKEKEKWAAELTIANKELVFQNDEKEKRAAELKLAEIERAKLVHELLQRNKELEQFAYIVSHNLRAPVANVIGASAALDEMGLTTAEKVILNKGIRTSVIKIDEVIHDLNQILQVKGKIKEAKEIVSFSELVDDIKATIARLADQNDVEIKYDFPDVDEYFTVKPYLYSIFLNLISNSVKYRRPGNHCVIEIMSHLLKDKIELTFSDNGMGIDLDKKGGQVFGLYKRFHTNIEGKGIGLFMVKTQVEALGGKISLKSKENVGTEFKIEFEI